jgi:hypothetical protein
MNGGTALKLPIVLICLSFLLIGCGEKSPYPPDVTEALKEAGENRAELEQVLIHYLDGTDTLKYQAACFLIGNMEGHCYATYVLHDTTGAEIEFDPLDYPDFDALLAAADSIERLKGELDFDKDTLIYDLHVIDSTFLINQIDYAFEAWRTKPWSAGMSFENFCRYVLPYRGSNEPLESWREYFREKYSDIDSSLSDPGDPIEVADRINDDIKSWFGFDPRYYYHPTDQGLAEMIKTGLGRCEDMTNLTIYAMRAVGLAVTSDYTPFWANSGNNHAWNAILTADGKVIPFMGAEANPGNYKLANKLAKVYRKTYDKQKGNLAFQKHKQQKVPGWLAGKSYLDVTFDYTNVCDVTVTFDKDIPDSVDIAYICVFNSGEWQAIDWGRIEDGEAIFTDMGADIAYLPALYLNEKIVPYGTPFILGVDCQIQKCQPVDNELMSVELISTTRRQQAISTDGVAETYFNPGQQYELFYWADGWQSLGKLVAEDHKTLSYDNIPSHGLYWLVADDSDKEERIFTIGDGRQVWW